MFWKFGNLEITWNLCRRVGLETKDNPATSLGFKHRSAEGAGHTTGRARFEDSASE